MTIIDQAARPDAAEVSKTVVRLEASRDKSTGKGIFPRIPATSPSADRFEPITLSEVATLYSFTVIHPNPKTGLTPFVLVYADFPEDARVFGRLELPEGQRPAIGMTIRPVSERAAPMSASTSYTFELA
ncbi:OB-fold domain-containing protein [Rhizobium sp. P32RR-XVIII]|uniref:Zn-ribbon domain-containing OB-fold protein n=1 Tax=Rhizobium sp. P32RR-XVIII TaxID=2726738 RepID=UPI00145718E1|nr:OB-fold domain-containing protein [Rhizobium sp. P32RR-XVIII]NLS04149.1 OB-fold domain-containing protein [Rhizobium sp. P32RR-XVIII]